MKIWVVIRHNEEPDVNGEMVTLIAAFRDEADASAALAAYRQTAADFSLYPVDLA